ncbi:putative ribonuclease H domain, reverse transcriptase zinc-binding domain-containing protein [Arabidopsis thaliana]
MIHPLLFADDSLFICKANAEESQVLLETLAAYGATTGQVVNPSKSSISFGVKVDEVTKKLIQDKLGIFKEGGAGTYLGLPECFSGSKIDLLNYLKDRLKSKLSGWFTKNLSQGGKEVLLKAVALAMPVFAMSCFKLPKTTCENLSSAMSSFWWSSTEGGKKINWVSWEKMCLSKELGGLGFKDIQLFNQALLAKQAWRLIQFSDSLFSSIMKARYFPLFDFLEAGLGSRPSFAWRSILHGRELLKKGLLKRVGNGNSIRVWMDPWIEDVAVRMPWIMNPIINIELRVKDLIDYRNRDCDIHKLEEHFFTGDILKIRKKKPLVSQEDFLIWRHNKSGDFSVKSAYWLACQIQNSEVRRDASNFPSINTLKDQAWKLQTDPKIKVFLWKALSGALPVADRLNRRGMRLDNVCQGCGGSDETINHVLFSCPIARQIWALSDYPSPEFGFDKGSVFSNINHLLINRDNRNWPSLLKKKFPWIIWRIWKNRNSLFFEGNQFLASDTISKIDDDNTSSPVVELGRTVTPSATCPNVWKPPPSSWLKCNVGCAWSAGNSLLGCSWVLRDERGVVLLHSRNAIPNIRDKDSASFQAAFWSLESLLSLGITKVILETDDASLVGCVLRPKAWPSFKGETLELLGLLERFQS